MTLPLLSDESRAVGMVYGAADNVEQAKAARLTLVIGADGRVQHIFKPADVAAHAAEILAVL